MVPVIVESAAGTDTVERRLELGQWSLVPSWSQELKLKFPTFNARSEDIPSKSTWKDPVKSHRAIIPASGYYEWNTATDGTKTPFYIHPPDGETMALAGLYSGWPNRSLPEDHKDFWTPTATILTSSAVDELLGIHDRNPVPLPRDWWDDWLNPELDGDQNFVDAAVAAALPVASSLEIRQVAPPKGDGPELIAAV
jgi:putative SOS response-associated peptidase YedK